MNWSRTGLAALAPITWGTTYLVTTEWLPPDRPLLSAALRALPAGLLVLAATRTLPKDGWWWRAVVLGVLNIGAFFALLFMAAYRLPGGVASTLGAVQPLVVAGLAIPLLGERPTGWRLGWGIAGTVGVAVMVLRGQVGFDPVGIVAGLLGTAAMASGVVLTKRWGRPEGVGVLAFTGWQLTAGGLFLAPLALGIEGWPPALTGVNVAGYAWLGGVGTLLAYALWFNGVGRLPVAALSFLPLLSPAVATLLGAFVLHQSLTVAQGVGFGLALLSIAAAQFRPLRTSWKRGNPLRVTVFGAAGGVGREVVAEALRRGHSVTAVVRDAGRFAELPSGATPAVGDANDVADVRKLSEGRDIVITATRPAPGRESELVTTVRTQLTALTDTGIRLLVVGGAATLVTPNGGTVLDDPDFPAELRPIALACAEQLDACRAEDAVDWTYLSPPAVLEPGRRTGKYRSGTDELLVSADGASWISTADFAVALLDEVQAHQHSRNRFTVGY